jgi:hypothetical protein
MDLNDILLIAVTMAILVHGYCSRKRYMPGVLISMLVAQIPTSVKIGEMGTSEYMKTIANVSSQSWMVGISYIFFVWGIGYVLGGIDIKKKVNNDELPGKDMEPDVYRLD